MLLLRLWNYIRGYVIILVEGYFLEKFINICTHRQIFLWDVRRSKSTCMTLKTSLAGFKSVRPVARKAKCRVRIYRKKGLPFLINRYKRRKSFAIGAVVFAALFFIMGSYIWDVEVIGIEKLDQDRVLDVLAYAGVKQGVLKFGVDTENAVNLLMMEIKELAWVGISVKGTRVRVQVTERIQPPELVPKDIPCNIVAKRDGVIKTISAKAGLESVKPGNTVSKGQVLISGSIPNRNDEKSFKLVHAIGAVRARTWYDGSSAVETVFYQKKRTGAFLDNYRVIILTRNFDFFKKEVDYADYDKIEIRKRVSIGNDLVLPFELVIDRYCENSMEQYERSLEEAREAAYDSAFSEAVKPISDGTEIVKTNVSHTQDKSGRQLVNVVVECIEDIGVTTQIGGN